MPTYARSSPGSRAKIYSAGRGFDCYCLIEFQTDVVVRGKNGRVLDLVEGSDLPIVEEGPLDDLPLRVADHRLRKVYHLGVGRQGALTNSLKKPET